MREEGLGSNEVWGRRGEGAGVMEEGLEIMEKG